MKYISLILIMVLAGCATGSNSKVEISTGKCYVENIQEGEK